MLTWALCWMQVNLVRSERVESAHVGPILWVLAIVGDVAIAYFAFRAVEALVAF